MSAPTLFRENTRTARKDHTCCECNDRIKKGRKYIDLNGLWEDEWHAYKMCSFCHQTMLDSMDILSSYDAPNIGELWVTLSDSDIAQPIWSTARYEK